MALASNHMFEPNSNEKKDAVRLRMSWECVENEMVVYFSMFTLVHAESVRCACPHVKTTTITTQNEWHLPKEHILFDLLRFGWACFDTKSPFVRRNIMTMVRIGCAVPTYACIVCACVWQGVGEILKWAHKKPQQYFFTLLSASSCLSTCVFFPSPL